MAFYSEQHDVLRSICSDAELKELEGGGCLFIFLPQEVAQLYVLSAKYRVIYAMLPDEYADILDIDKNVKSFIVIVQKNDAGLIQTVCRQFGIGFEKFDSTFNQLNGRVDTHVQITYGRM